MTRGGGTSDLGLDAPLPIRSHKPTYRIRIQRPALLLAAALAKKKLNPNLQSNKLEPNQQDSHPEEELKDTPWLQPRVHDMDVGRVPLSFLEAYVVGPRLGKGGYGVVYGCTHKETGREFAVKVVRKKYRVNRSDFHEFFMTGELQGHANIARIYELYHDSEQTYSITDWFKGGDLLQVVTQQTGCLSEQVVAVLATRVLSALHHCHTAKRIVHRDLKLENLMIPDALDIRALESKDVDSRDQMLCHAMAQVQLIDFGMAATLDYSADGNCKPMTSIVGSPAYMSPDVLRGYYDPIKADIWSCGVLVFSVLAGFPPFEADDDAEIMRRILSYRDGDLFAGEPKTRDRISPACLDFVKLLLTADERMRPTAAQALLHPWLHQTRMQKYNDPDNRPLMQDESSNTTKNFASEENDDRPCYGATAYPPQTTASSFSTTPSQKTSLTSNVSMTTIMSMEFIAIKPFLICP